MGGGGPSPPSPMAWQGLALPSPMDCGTAGSGITVTCATMGWQGPALPPSPLPPPPVLPQPRWQEGTGVPQGTARPVRRRKRTRTEGREGREGGREDARPGSFAASPRLWGPTPISPAFLGIAACGQASHGSHPGDGTGVVPSRPWGHQTPPDPQDDARGATSSSLCPVPTYGMGPRH